MANGSIREELIFQDIHSTNSCSSFDDAYNRGLEKEPGPRNRRAPVQLDARRSVKTRFYSVDQLNPLTVRCATCGKQPGEPCRDDRTFCYLRLHEAKRAWAVQP